MQSTTTKPGDESSATDVHWSKSTLRASEIPWLFDVLVIDDDPADTWLIAEVLEHDPRVRRAILTDAPDEILVQLHRGDVRPHLILVDIKMPKITGFEFVTRLRAIPAMADVPVAILTTSRNVTDVDIARNRGICRYVIKPDSYELLRARLAELVGGAMEEWRKK
jgi:CheY-like chemotaxis protein